MSKIEGQPQAIELSAKIVRLQQEKDRSIDNLADRQDRHSRDRLLEAASAATNILLTLDNLDEAIDTALSILGEGSGCDRINVLDNFYTSRATLPAYFTVIYEWARPGIIRQMDHLEAGRIYATGIEPFFERYYLRGDGFGGLLAEWDEPLRSAFAAIGVESSYSVPIRVKEQWWGVLCLDYCQSPVRVSPAEIAVLKTIAACIGSAIQRDRTQKVTLQAQQARSQELQVLNVELQQTLDRLATRERILEATATVANAILTTENLDESIARSLQIIGEILDTDRVQVFEIGEFDRSADLSSVCWKLIYEWHSAAAISQISDAASAMGNFEGIEEWLELSLNGQCVSYLLAEMPEPFRSGQAALGVKALHCVPIFVDDRYWGNFGIDDCREAKRRSSGELAALKTIAACIGSAIQRDRTQTATLQAQQARSQELQLLNTELQQTLDRLATRERLLEATATTANVLLTIPQDGGCANDNFDAVVDNALQILGESLETDRIKILEHSFDDPMSRYPGSSKAIYEWTRDGTIPQISHIAGEIVVRGLEDFIESFLLNDGFGGLVDEWIEPFRSNFKQLDVKSTTCVPIRVEGQFWGVLAFDDCREAKYRSQAEIAVLKTVANCIGSAIQRDRTQTATLQAQQARSQELERLNTELQQTLDRLTASEDDLRTLFELSSEGLYFGRTEPPIPIDLPIEAQCELLYQNCRVLKANPAFVAMYGANHSDEILGMRNSDSHVEGSQKNRTFIRRIVESGYKFSNLETEEIDRHGQRRYFLNSGFGIIRENLFIGGWASQIDITELRQAQQALLQAERDRVAELAKTNQALKNNLDRLAAEPNLEAFLGHVLTEISQQLEMHTAWLYLYDPQTQTLQLNNWVENGIVQPIERFGDLEPLAEPISIASTPIWKHLCHTKSPFVITRDNAAELLFAGTENWQLQWADRHGIHSGIDILLGVGDKPLGLLRLLSDRRSEFTSEELELAQALSQQATLAIQLTQLAAEAQQAALFEERNRLAGEIHDTLAQTFTGISVQLELVKYLNPQHSNEVRSILDRISSLAQTGLSEARRSVWSIYSANEDFADLARQLADCVENLTVGTDLHTQIKIVGTPTPLSSFVGVNLLRIGQESIVNTLKHAQASTLAIALEYSPHQVSLCIKDNGSGFSPQVQTEGFGLISISERVDRLGGQLRITTQPGQGTEIFVQVPL